jgi:hypothetical protein
MRPCETGMSETRQRRVGPRLCSRADTALLTNSQFLDHYTISAYILCLEVIQKTPALANHSQQASARMMVFGMNLEVLRQIVNSLAEEGNLHFRRTRIRIMSAVRVD